jgi:hypothetical protein
VNSALRRVVGRLPPHAQEHLRRLARSPRARRALRPVRWGNLRRLQPVSPRWGSERGSAVDRHYIDAFFARHSELIRGRVLEVRDPRYATSCGNGVTTIDVVDIDPRNDDATIIADLADPGSLPTFAFDCAIVPQTLVYVRDPFAAAANLWQSIAPGGALLVTTPAIARVDPDAVEDDRWHLTRAGLETVIRRACPDGEYSVQAHGNPIVATAFLQGVAAEELRADELDAHHPLFPIVVTARVRKPHT